jgi:hypothetical protein
MKYYSPNRDLCHDKIQTNQKYNPFRLISVQFDFLFSKIKNFKYEKIGFNY